MHKPLSPAGTRVLAAALMTALFGYPASGFASPPASMLILAATAQGQDADEEYVDEEEDVPQDAEEDAGEEEPVEEELAEEEPVEEEIAEEVVEEEADEEPLAQDQEMDNEVVEEEVVEEDAVGEEADEEALAQQEEEAGSEDDASHDETEVLAEAGTQDEDEEEVYIDGGDYIIEDDMPDDSWAGDWEEEEEYEEDDVIPVDESQFGGDEVWLVEEEGDYEDDDTGDSVGGGMLSIRTVKRTPGKKPGSKPPRLARDSKDTVYSFGGRPISATSVPWQAQILYPGAPPKPDKSGQDRRAPWQREHYCGGALIAPNWVLTAAHCIDQNEVDEGFKVRLGMQDISKGDGVLFKIDRIVRHSQYNADSEDIANPPNMYANDIALVHIVPEGKPVPIDSRRVRQIPINRTPLPAAAPVTATGWGITGSRGDARRMNATLLSVNLRAMPNTFCQALEGYGPGKIKGQVFCAAHPKQSTCRGDSGGPVILTNGTPLLVGLVSWGKEICAGDGNPGVYTRIDQYVQWIDQAMKLPPGQNRLP